MVDLDGDVEPQGGSNPPPRNDGDDDDDVMRGKGPVVEDAEDIVSSRKGLVLGKGTILKGDHFPGAHNKKLRPIIDGAPNFRQVAGLPVYGVAIPTVEGITNVLDAVHDAQNLSTFYWHNMREEPVLYINGKPYVLREIEQPFANVEYTGISHKRVEEMEARLKRDVLHEVSEYGGILVCSESEDGELLNNWEAVESGDVQTPAEVYEEIRRDLGYDVHYFRIPVTDERSPKLIDFDILMKYCSGAPDDAALIFNCQMGRGRTTTAMIVATFLKVRSLLHLGDLDLVPEWAAEAFTSQASPLQSPPFTQSPAKEDSANAERLKRGDFSLVRSLLRVLEKGPEGKLQMDAVIDACASFQNLRESIVTYRDRFLKAVTETQRENFQRVVVDYLERYFMLITFGAYLITVAPDRQGSGESDGAGHDADRHTGEAQPSFKLWVSSRHELYSICERLLWRNPLTAMEVDTRGGRHTSGADAAPSEEDENASFIANRVGYVLGPHTVIKEDHFPGLHSSILPTLEGAPNFRQACEGLPVFGLAIPTESGIRRVLDQTGIRPAKEPSSLERGGGVGKRRVMWFNMREEPVVYINGRPYVLREHSRPFKNMQEYSRISTSRVESMEKRLKEDVLAESRSSGGSILVTREHAPDGVRVIHDDWERVDTEDAVCTPSEIFSSLQREGYPIEYARIPVTDGRAPQLSDVDAIVAQAAFADQHTLLVFNCQGGSGRTTTGMIIGSLLHLRRLNKLTAIPHAMLSSLVRRASVDTSQASDPEIFDVKRDHVWEDEDDDEDDEDGDPTSSAELADDSHRLQDDVSMTLKQGNYLVIQKLVHLLDSGSESKGIVDLVIDACGKLKNLRQAIFAYRRPRRRRGPSWGRGDEWFQGRSNAFKKGIEYLERYFVLIAFGCWLDDDKSYNHGLGSFYEWFTGMRDLRDLKKTIRTNPGAALSATFPLIEKQQITEVDINSVAYEQRFYLASRCGLILKNNTILKSYIFPEMQVSYLQQLPNVTNYFESDKVPISTASAPTVEGMEFLLSKLGCGPKDNSTGDLGGSKVVVVDLREELVIYVNGCPYVIRGIDFATKGLNLTGISSAKVEQREVQVKKDIIEESEKYGGQILLHHEVSRGAMERVPSLKQLGAVPEKEPTDITKAFDRRPDAQSRHSKLEAFWEKIDCGDSVSTALEVCQKLKDKGFCIEYVRHPLSRERSPAAMDFETLQDAITKFGHEEGRKVKYLFISHTGTGCGMRYAPVVVSCYYLIREQKLATEKLAEDVLLSAGPVDASDSDSDNRGIAALTRVIADGPLCKQIVDHSISYFSTIGDIREDIIRCRDASEACTGDGQLRDSYVAAKLLGLNYLHRYFYLIVYVCYLRSSDSKPSSKFSKWIHDRSELSYLLTNLSIE